MTIYVIIYAVIDRQNMYRPIIPLCFKLSPIPLSWQHSHSQCGCALFLICFIEPALLAIELKTLNLVFRNVDRVTDGQL